VPILMFSKYAQVTEKISQCPVNYHGFGNIECTGLRCSVIFHLQKISIMFSNVDTFSNISLTVDIK
jgi:hypothetical protein